MTTPQQEIRDGAEMPTWMPPRLRDCIRKGCFICIEHAPAVRPRYTSWEIWGRPQCYSGDAPALDREIEDCKSVYPEHHVRLNIEDVSFHSRMNLFVHRPPVALSTAA